jgi:hypothetical protein
MGAGHNRAGGRGGGSGTDIERRVIRNESYDNSCAHYRRDGCRAYALADAASGVGDAQQRYADPDAYAPALAHGRSDCHTYRRADSNICDRTD